MIIDQVIMKAYRTAMMMITMSIIEMMNDQYANQLVKQMKQPIAIKQIKSTSRRVVAGAERKR